MRDGDERVKRKYVELAENEICAVGYGVEEGKKNVRPSFGEKKNP